MLIFRTPQATLNSTSSAPTVNSAPSAVAPDDQLLFLGGSPQAKAPEPAPSITPTPAPLVQAAVAATPMQPQPVAATPPQPVPTTQTVLSLGDVFVPLESIQPGKFDGRVQGWARTFQ